LAQAGDIEELGEAEVDELLMHMSLADDGQVSTSSARQVAIVLKCRMLISA
jgi:hypothetical protein